MLECLDVVEWNIVYQMNNSCYKSYTLESVQKLGESDNQTVQCGDESWKKVESCRTRLRFIVKITVFFVNKEKEHPERINTLKQ